MKPVVLITGASGFLGKHVFKAFDKIGYEIHTLGRTKVDSSLHVEADMKSGAIELTDATYAHVVHVAGKAHSYPKTESEKRDFVEINFEGTKRLLSALEKVGVPNLLTFISTVAVYGIDEGTDIKETQPTLPKTVYGESKLNAEQAIIDWCGKNKVSYLILRLPLIAGINAPGNLGNMKAAIAKGRYPRITNNHARKSIVAAAQVADLIANYKGAVSGIYHLTDGSHPSFEEIEDALIKRTGKNIGINLPLWLIKMLGKAGDIVETLTRRTFPISSLKIKKLTGTLTFNDTKAMEELSWKHKSILPFLEEEI